MPFQESFKLNDGKAIPWLAIGTGTALYGQDATKSITEAINSGVTHLDGAQVYGNESSLGAGIAASGVARSNLFVTTKLGSIPNGKTVVDTLKESLGKLQLDYVDLFLIHAPFEHSDLLSVWKGMEEAHKAGLAKSIGVSNHRVKDLEKILSGGTVVPAVNQVRKFLNYAADQ
jgi:diketogulonate reductase-like aldo/keto reductase